MGQGFFLDTSEIQPSKVVTQSSERLSKGCTFCSMRRQCLSPKMEPTGKNALRICIVGEAPGEKEDRVGKPFVGASGQLLRNAFRGFDIDLDEDCVLTNVVQCRPKNNKFPDATVVDNCSLRVEAQLELYRPHIIFATGVEAVKAILKPPFSVSARQMHGRVIPSHKYKCWVCCLFHPAYVLREEDAVLEMIWKDDIARGLDCMDKYPFFGLDEDSFHIIDSVDSACDYLDKLALWKGKSTVDRSASVERISLDIETNSLSPYSDKAKILTVAFSIDPNHGRVIPLEFHGFWRNDQLSRIYESFRRFLSSPAPKVIQNADFERIWCKQILGVDIGGDVWDTMIVSHIIDERPGTCGLEFQVFCRSGVVFKDMVNHSRLEVERLESLAKYNALDARYELYIQKLQEEELGGGKQRNAADFFNHSAICLTNMKHRGITVDANVISSMEREIDEGIRKLRTMFESLDCVKEFEKEGRKFNPDSRKDVLRLIYDILGVAPLEGRRTPGGGLPTDDESFTELLLREVTAEIETTICGILENRKLVKQKSTYCEGLKKVIHSDGRLHPSFMLHTARSFRSSSEGPNFQNFPKRNPDARRIRRAIIPRNGIFVEGDFDGAEICVMAMCSEDVNLRKQLAEGFDLHAFWGETLFGKEPGHLTKDERFRAKNMFVFPLFYGSWYKPCAHDLELPEEHVKKVEETFWGYYPGIKEYHNRKFSFYDKHGYIELPLGFRRHGPMRRNVQINTEIQGTAFHLLLAGAAEVDQVMIETGMRSALVGQIHDSVLIDTHPDELEIVVEIMNECLTRERFPFMEGVRMSVSYAIGTNWCDMEEV